LLENPLHIYSSAGKFTVILIATDPNDTEQNY